jgi:autotransporter-associated beta strand protein
MFAKKSISTRAIKFIFATAVCAVVNSPQVHAQNLISNGGFDNGLTDWTQASWAGGSSFGINANGPANTSAASGNYAYAGGGAYNLLQQNISGITAGNAYRLTFLAGAKSGQAANGVLSLFDGLAGSYNSASFDYNPSDAAFGSYTVDFTARGATDLWLRSDSTYAAYDNVSVTAIGSVANALNYSSASGYSQIKSALTGSGKVTVNAGTGGLSLIGANTHTGGTEVTGGTLFVAGAGTLGAASGNVTVTGTGGSEVKLDLRNQQTLTGTITMTGDNARIIAGDANNVGSLVNNGSIQFGGGKLAVAVSGSGGINVTGGGTIDSSNSYTGATTISGTTGWYGTGQLFVNNANALGAASGDLTISGGYVNLQSNTITRSGSVILSGGTIANGTLGKSGGNFDLQGGTVNASLAGTSGLIKSTTNGASLNASNSYTGGTTISGGKLFVGGSGTLGDAGGDITVSGTGSASTEVVLELRSQQTRTGTITMTNQDVRIINGGGGSIVNNGAFRFGGGLLDVGVSGTGGLNVTGGGVINSSNSYTGATTISGTTGWYGTDQLFVNNTNALGAASGDLTISGGNVNLQTNTITRSGNVIISGGTLTTGTLNKSGGVFALQGGNGSIAVTLAGTAGLTKSGAGTSYLWLSNSYTGATTISEGTLVTDGEGQLTAGTTLAISNGATWQMTGTASGNGATRTIGGLTGDGTVQTTTSGFTHNLAVNKSSGSDTFSGVIAGSGALIKQGAGTLVLGGVNSYTGATEVNAGTLVISNASLSATILSNSIAVVFASAPDAGTYPILPGELAGNSLGVILPVEGLGIGQTATVVNDPNLVVQVTGGSADATFEDAYPSIDPLAVNPANGLTYLMNYALGGTGPNSTPALPVLTVDGNGLTLTATVRNDDPRLRFYGQWTTDLSGTTDSWEDHTVELTPPDLSFSQDVETNKPRKFMRLKVTRQ